jgi:hypothetical protein
MATREEVMSTAERLIRRGELGEAAALLEMWTRANPTDQAAASRLASVRELADPLPSTPRPTARPPSPAAIAAPPRPTPPGSKPDDPIAALQALLARIQSNRR